MNFKSDLVLGAEISAGFFGKVFHAVDPVRGNVAVKILHQYPGEPDADWLVRKTTLLNEAQRLSQAEHKNIVRVHHLVKHASDDIRRRARRALHSTWIADLRRRCEAIAKAKHLVVGYDVELWCGERFVIRLEVTTK